MKLIYPVIIGIWIVTIIIVTSYVDVKQGDGTIENQKQLYQITVYHPGGISISCSYNAYCEHGVCYWEDALGMISAVGGVKIEVHSNCKSVEVIYDRIDWKNEMVEFCNRKPRHCK